MSGRRMDRIFEDVGGLLAEQSSGRGLEEYARYADDPAGFVRNVLGGDPWARQVEIAEAVRDHPQVTVRSCHAAGKDWLAARLALWWVYARRGLCVLSGPTITQVEEILMRKEVRRPFVRASLPGSLHVRALRPTGEGAAGILAKTGSGVSSLTGFHEARVLFIITEAQDPDIEHAWDAAFACTTGGDDRLLTMGNPTEPTGRFYNAHHRPSGWQAFKIEAADIPNVQEERTVVPGLLTKAGVDRFITEYGPESPFVQSRVYAEFPDVSEDALVTRETVEAAMGRWAVADVPIYPLTLGVDPARLGPDRTAVCIREKNVARAFETWRGLDTMQTADRVTALVAGLVRDGAKVTAVVVDEVGLGGGVLDRLKVTLRDVSWREDRESRFRGTHRVEVRPKVVGFNAGGRAGLPERFRNLRAQAFWRVREKLQEHTLALPEDPDLLEELVATRVRFTANGKTEMEAKEDLKGRLGRSPDLADALAISLAPELEEADAATFAFA